MELPDLFFFGRCSFLFLQRLYFYSLGLYFPVVRDFFKYNSPYPFASSSSARTYPSAFFSAGSHFSDIARAAFSSTSLMMAFSLYRVFLFPFPFLFL